MIKYNDDVIAGMIMQEKRQKAIAKRALKIAVRIGVVYLIALLACATVIH